MYIGLIEWDSSYDPSIIVGPDPHAVRREAIRALTHTDPETGQVSLAWDDDEVDDEPAFLEDHPLPDLDDPQAVREWLDAMREALTVPWVSLYAPERTRESTPDASNSAAPCGPEAHLTYQIARPVPMGSFTATTAPSRA